MRARERQADELSVCLYLATLVIQILGAFFRGSPCSPNVQLKTCGLGLTLGVNERVNSGKSLSVGLVTDWQPVRGIASSRPMTAGIGYSLVRPFLKPCPQA